ncbi:hypothetical protein J6590_000305 [Homalodisca vitripennis]|nr:hypothetical protein J6590_000305 [Homalodisca vitripennis]
MKRLAVWSQAGPAENSPLDVTVGLVSSDAMELRKRYRLLPSLSYVASALAHGQITVQPFPTHIFPTAACRNTPITQYCAVHLVVSTTTLYRNVTSRHVTARQVTERIGTEWWLATLTTPARSVTESANCSVAFVVNCCNSVQCCCSTALVIPATTSAAQCHGPVLKLSVLFRTNPCGVPTVVARLCLWSDTALVARVQQGAACG